jgi:hypothetical protein
LTSFSAVGLTNVTDCKQAWDGCIALTSFSTVGLEKVLLCNNTWSNCTSMVTFDSNSLSSVTDCTDAWNPTRQWTLGLASESPTTFVYTPGGQLTTATGWNPTIVSGSNPWVTVVP